MTEAARIAASLSEQERDIAVALCGNAWFGSGDPTPGIIVAYDLGLLKVNRLGERYKAYPTALGRAVRKHIEEQDQ